MARFLAALVVLAAAAALAACGAQDESEPTSANTTGDAMSETETGSGEGSVLSGNLPLLNGKSQELAEFEGDVVLVVNTASECGFTPQFEELEELYDRHREDGFTVLGFPADDVAGQEPRDDKAIADFCEANFGVSFPMFAKSNVVADPVNPLFASLTEAAGAPNWNFNKYLVDRSGGVVGRWDATTAPDDPELGARIDELLARS